ncbi:MAG: ketopantoate reductase family protein [Promethearchaeota archaeon]
MLNEKKIKNILICGIGGVGGYFGGRIANKISQEYQNKYKIYFLARGDHLKKITKVGLELHTSNGKKLICKPTLASDKIKDFPKPDLCVICVKSYDLDILVLNLKKIIYKDVIIIPLMNGIDIYDRVRKSLQKGIVLPTCVYVGSHIEEPGLVMQTGNPGFFRSGFDPKYPNVKPETVINFFNKMGIHMEWCNDPHPAIWEKYLLVASFALVCTYTGKTIGGVIYDDQSLQLLRDVMKEIVAIASKKEIKLPNNIIEHTIEFCKDYPDVKPSYQRDIEKGGKNEGDLFGGAIIRMGKEFGIPTPFTEKIYSKLK